MTSTELLKEVRTITQSNMDAITSNFENLSQEQVAWKSVENSWNIQEIFAHLNKFAQYYHEAFFKYISKTKFQTPSENFISSPLGRSAWKSMKLGNAKNIKRKFKAIKSNNPLFEKDLIKGNDVELFKSNLITLNSIFEACANVNIRKVKIPISISKIVRLRLGDALLFVVYHNERHVQQALNVLNHPNFPK